MQPLPHRDLRSPEELAQPPVAVLLVLQPLVVLAHQMPRHQQGRGEGDRACPGGSPMPGNGSRKDYKPGAAKAFNDGAILGGGGLADQVAKAATARRQKKEAAHG